VDSNLFHYCGSLFYADCRVNNWYQNLVQIGVFTKSDGSNTHGLHLLGNQKWGNKTWRWRYHLMTCRLKARCLLHCLAHQSIYLGCTGHTIIKQDDISKKKKKAHFVVFLNNYLDRKKEILNELSSSNILKVGMQKCRTKLSYKLKIIFWKRSK
jgi:hypothetical protein